MVSSQTLAMQNRVLPQAIVPPIPDAAVDTPPLHKLGSSLPEATATAPGPSPSPLPTASPPLFIGNVPLAHPLVTDDKIAAAFHQSSRKTLSDHVRSVWPMVHEEQPIVLQKWEPGIVLRKLKHTQVPVWVKLRHLPVELWNTTGLSTVASGIRRPLYPDAITCACTRLDFARVCVMLDISSTLPKHIVIMVPKEDGSESACKVDVEYEWLPPKCTTCMSLGHATRMCPTMKQKQPAVSVYVPKVDAMNKVPERRETVQEGERAESSAPSVIARIPPVDRGDKGKAIVFYNPFDALSTFDIGAESSKGPLAALSWKVMISAAVWIVRGLNRIDHQGPGRTHFILVLPPGLQTTPLLCYEGTPFLVLAQRQRKGDLSNNVKLAATFLDTAQTLLAQDRLNPVLLHLEYCCRLVMRLPSKLEQNMLHQRAKLAWLKGGDQCSRIFFRKVASRRASKRLFHIRNEVGETLTDQQDVVNEFVSFYRSLLGGEQRARSIDLGYLRPWARRIISEEEGRHLIQSVTPAEAAWPIVGSEVTQAILEFFANGKLLKQVNATLLSLIPKVQQPTLVAEFRPISCCNVLYKELFTGYNRQHLPPRCALKVDIRKAYDTVERDFLRAVLQLFGFPALFISWIEECVTTPSFSVCLNGSPHGFFRGARGLRQGDPISPYLFVLVMEVLNLILQQIIAQDGGFSYHWRCEAVHLFQLGFADDLLLFSTADESSIHIFKRGLSIFADLSGLHVNLQKSHLILSRSAAAIRETLLSILDYQERVLPVRYLGLPLLASRLTIADCTPLLLKIDSRIKGWDGIMLSFAGRVQLIKSVLLALQMYWAMAFILPKGIIKEIEKHLRSFLWKGTMGVGYAKVSYHQVCRPVEEGGLGIRDLLP
ncbi:UNVERIFIED_CONTAM: LINE-1 retrotransposable element O protein [Sesamum latifolium]|uniref:LINE-1 retrotransposable element O protein n=1 Tax=Sesamum latifolium TaxID=2727402 RepID=A0AAW2XPZ7_9LAMI